ncbi:MAG: Isoleucine-tRNA ligase [Candidatus Gottesmanbacteria bacterium GW2011_GWB1_43_11]|uniref:Isoleucine--tRNA ligase n=1 Tax=Candidatus Gottesmanbacteria bacterium GW2011_GWB1_43_11 TaxID=1618446 RepID=A0A0G1EX17_9BACT|nr:MAG: Isoleucine-tRNA ligase [Candidatus Gottesmanbacteria bacterium GW2011_GWA2_42_16]KKS87541.1 MAG: Isoleucine-tRNA ligase [Candidatus Gottesmanbacteria bacterium GW2011_GWB1_43_11]
MTNFFFSAQYDYEYMTTLKLTNFQQKYNLPELEHRVLEFWDETQAFEKSVETRDPQKPYVFYDGPPFATGLPHYGHILASTIKDVVPRYWTMKGFRVNRVWGWDCHGIPIENMIEKELDLKGGKKGIEEMGIDKFNAACRAAILRFDKEWEKVIRRIGRWVDFKNSYKTMDKSFMESVWWAFKTLHDKGLVYEGKRVILYCPRCATPLSNFEIAMDNSYKDVEDNSVYVKFRVKGKTNEYFVAWTTTPWTLIGNVALAVDAKAQYVKVKSGDEYLWMAERLVNVILNKVKDLATKGSVDASLDSSAPPQNDMLILETVKGSALAGREYEPLYSYMPLDGKKAYYVGAADFVSLEEGTGLVHTAAIFGEDDYRFAVQHDLPRVPTLDDQGKFLDFVTPLKGVFYKKGESWIVDDLSKRGLMLRAEKTIHSYPFCYRCETPLYYNAVPAWFINVQKIKPELLKQNENINWYPKHLKHGRFGKGLETAPDWNISRSRYWGTPMPVWRSQTVQSSKLKVKSEVGKDFRIIGSLEELKKWAVDPRQVEKLTDIHREYLDDLEVWVDGAKTIKGKRVPEVFDCWIESGSMPYASLHYPFANEQTFKNSHPAQFIAEYIAQTRAWFYTLHVMSVGLFDKHTFENAVTTGTILAEDGTKMSKSKKNFPDPTLLFEKYGVDALRFYLMSSVVMKGENLNFSEAQVKELFQKTVQLLWNTFSFYKLYAQDNYQIKALDQLEITQVLDKWIVSKTHSLIKSVSQAMDHYDTVTSCRAILEFINELSTWYLRRSRERFKENPAAMEVFGWVLKQLVLVMAPFTPFISELIYQNLLAGESVHLGSWPTWDENHIHEQLEENMTLVRQIVEKAHAQRKAAQIKVRQPLSELRITNYELRIENELLEIIKEEVNVKKILVVQGKGELEVTLDTELTDELKIEGKARELIRLIQDLRKEKGLGVSEKVKIQLTKTYADLPQDLLADVKRKTLVESVVWGDKLELLPG